MKVDKETLLKHHFWIVLGSFALLWLIGLCFMLFTLGDEIRKHKDDYTKKKEAVKTAKDTPGGPKNPVTFLPPWQKHQAMFLKHKDDVWTVGWALQKDIYDWPSRNLQRKMTDPSVQLSYEERDEFKKTHYDLYFDALRARFKERYEAKGIAPVEFGSPFNDLMGRVTFLVQGEETPLPTHEDIWLAMEDLWMKRELLDIVRNVLESDSKMEFKEVVQASDPAGKSLPEGALARFRVANGTWELDLIIEKGEEARDRRISANSKIKNIHPGKRTLAVANPHNQAPLVFKIRQGGKAPLTLAVTGEPLAYLQEEAFGKTTDLPTLDLEAPFEVAQFFDWYSSPIKRIDKIVLGWPSSRTAGAPLVPKPDYALADGQATGGGPAPVGAKTPGKAAPTAAPQGSGAGPAGARPQAGGSSQESLTRFGLERNRYLQVKPECRHLPLGMAMVVDQSVVPDVMAAVANSRLRIQVTQVEMTHIPGIQPQTQPAADGGGRPAGGAPPANEGGRPRVGPVLGPGGNVPSRAAGGRTEASDANDPNLVELGVYGIAAVYENFEVYEKKKQPPAGAAAPAAPPAAAPAAGAKR
jgi:hypothetical protein